MALDKAPTTAVANLGSVPDQPINQNFNWALEVFFFYV